MLDAVVSAGPTSSPPVKAAISPAETRRGPSPSPSPTACTGAGPLGILPQALHDLARQVERRVRRDDVRAGGVGVEDQRVVAFGPEPLHHRVDALLDRREQLALPLSGPVLELIGALLDALLQGLQLLLLRLLGGGRERDRLLVERLDGRVELLLQLLHLVAVALHFLVEGGLRGGVAGRALEDLPRLDEADPDLGPRGRRLRRCPRTEIGRASCRERV